MTKIANPANVARQAGIPRRQAGRHEIDSAHTVTYNRTCCIDD
jgi:hypothetical protein